MLNKSAALLLSLLVAALAISTPARAADLFPVGATGYDVSFPQCDRPLPSSPRGFAIVGATGGKAFLQNPCLATQYAWASTSGRQPSLYMNLKSPVGTNADEAAAGPVGVCAPSDEMCRGYNFGYKAAQHAVAYAQSQSTPAASWWLDIETTSSWLSDTAANARVIAGAIDFLKAQGATVGIYSNPSQWQTIAGSYSPGLPVWTTTAPGAAEAPAFCSRAFAGGEVVLVQYISGGYDLNYACRAEDRVVAAGPPLGPPGSAATIAAEGDCLNVRALPSVSGTRSGCLPTGTTVTLLDGSVIADGYRWQLMSAGALTGWVAGNYLRAGAVAPPSPPLATFANAPRFGPGGQALVVFTGGGIDQLEAAAQAAGASGVWAQDVDGGYRLLVVRGPVFVNATFRAAFPAGLRGTTALTLVR